MSDSYEALTLYELVDMQMTLETVASLEEVLFAGHKFIVVGYNILLRWTVETFLGRLVQLAGNTVDNRGMRF